ncbi:MAG TPA: Cys-tRNA(Pro) deacylase [Clostridiales bacterium]|nr:Cys-tRNA(Pro) deacylase [Clostridiales bacterium]
MEKSEKTNAMRILESQGESYEPIYLSVIPTDGVSAANAIGCDPACVFKTLVTVGSDLSHYVFVIPVAQTLDLKKAAKAAGVKSVEMLPQKMLFPLTGYVHGGCSPIGMKKPFPTFFDETAILFDKIVTSAGKLGVFLRTAPCSFEKVVNVKYADLVR